MAPCIFCYAINVAYALANAINPKEFGLCQITSAYLGVELAQNIGERVLGTPGVTWHAGYGCVLFTWSFSYWSLEDTNDWSICFHHDSHSVLCLHIRGSSYYFFKFPSGFYFLEGIASSFNDCFLNVSRNTVLGLGDIDSLSVIYARFPSPKLAHCLRIHVHVGYTKLLACMDRPYHLRGATFGP